MSKKNRESHIEKQRGVAEPPQPAPANPETVINPASIISGGTTHVPSRPLTPEQARECDRLNLTLFTLRQARIEAQRAWFHDPRNPHKGDPGFDPDSPTALETYKRWAEVKSATTSPQQHQANGSTGPRTPEGKARSAQNAVRHGFASARVILDASEIEAYDDHLDAYRASFLPYNQAEADAVRRIADAQWRMDILKTAEATLVELEIEYECLVLTDHEKLARRESPWELRHYRTLSFIDITQERAWDLLHRYYADAAREYTRAFNVFRKLKELRGEEGLRESTLPPPEIQSIEPEPAAPAEPEMDEEVLQTQQVRNELPHRQSRQQQQPRQPQARGKSRRLNLGRLLR